MESTLIWSYAIRLTLDTPIDFAFSPPLIARILPFFLFCIYIGKDISRISARKYA